MSKRNKGRDLCRRFYSHNRGNPCQGWMLTSRRIAIIIFLQRWDCLRTGLTEVLFTNIISSIEGVARKYNRM
uniref:Uncharacterized protein n=1 Tax=Rhizophora mucronata TaxID=61149 RepID=A0A2P2QBL1_RHIMU